jgi:hypothetical protein
MVKRSSKPGVWSKTLASALIVAFSASLTWSSKASEPTSESGETAADLGFRPETDGFHFPNYGENYTIFKKTGGDIEQVPMSPTNLTAVEMRRMFGDQVCANDACDLTPQVEKWMEEKNQSMRGGHCEGFAVLIPFC